MTELDSALGRAGLRALMQPIVDLDDGKIVAYEALARGPEGSPLEAPDALFGAAREANRLAELDEQCMRTAVSAARTAGLERPTALFVNAEPETFDGPPPDLECREHEVVVEITERSLTTRPAELLLAVERVRRRGWGIAVDDVGADWRSLALLPFLRPDVVKLDRGVLADAACPESARVVRGVRGHIGRYGGLLLAEGIEDADHERRARAFGARLGQGWRYGRPEQLVRSEASRAQPGLPIVHPRAPISTETPFGMLRRHGLSPATATKQELLALSVDLEQQAIGTRDPAVVLATFQDADKFTARVRERYAELAQGAAFVGAFGVGLPPEPAPGCAARRSPTARRCATSGR
jgi:EAL domain-containing protein (putative c-di-GMP-specific phosphodiesterase class I)